MTAVANIDCVVLHSAEVRPALVTEPVPFNMSEGRERGKSHDLLLHCMLKRAEHERDINCGTMLKVVDRFVYKERVPFRGSFLLLEPTYIL